MKVDDDESGAVKLQISTVKKDNEWPIRPVRYTTYILNKAVIYFVNEKNKSNNNNRNLKKKAQGCCACV